MKPLKVLTINIVVLFGLLSLIEVAAQLVALVRPSYQVLFLQPDRRLGWKQVPNLSWHWAGHHWYAADFSVEVTTNPMGFRDKPRNFENPEGSKRIALIGDSFIEAVQVPFNQTAGQVLENELNNSIINSDLKKEQFEVLNFGTSNYGVGQYLLVWDEYVRKFKPDFVAIFVAQFHMRRTVDKFEVGAFKTTGERALWARPIFTLKDGKLIEIPAKDFGEFVQIQNELIQNEFYGTRSRRAIGWITLKYYKDLAGKAKRSAMRLLTKQQKVEPMRVADDQEAQTLDLNLQIIEQLGNEVKSMGAQFIIIDASEYFGDGKNIADSLKEEALRNNFGYIPLSEDLQNSISGGQSVVWSHDNHFNKEGNAILANSLLRWLSATDQQYVWRQHP